MKKRFERESRIVELKDEELEGTAGGNPLLMGIALGVATNLVYDKLKEGGVFDPVIDWNNLPGTGKGKKPA